MKKLIAISFLLGTFITGCNTPINDNLEAETVKSNISSETKRSTAISPMSSNLAKEIAQLFDKNKDGKISANEFFVSVYIKNGSTSGNEYKNWDSINKKELSPVDTNLIVKALTATTEPAYFSFGINTVGNSISDNDLEKFSTSLSNAVLKDTAFVSGKIPVGTTKYGMFSTKLVIENISSNSLKKALVKHLRNSGVLINLSNQVKTDGDKDSYRLDGLDNKYIVSNLRNFKIYNYC
ncbi:MAG: EF-hand domain-containing protein [Candidatus Sericytochromatia bacterium]